MRLSASGLWRVEACPASATLPATDAVFADAVHGSSAHAALEATAPEGSLAEVAFAYDVATGQAREIGRGLNRNYQGLKDTEIPGSTDLLTVGADHVVITDYKTGVGFLVQPPAKNLQLQFYALCAALVYGKQSAIVEVQYEDTGEIQHAEFDAFSFVEIHERIQRIWFAAAEGSGRVVEGEHCWRCPAAARCPAKVTLALAVANGELPADLNGLDLSPEAVAAGWPKVRRLEKLIDKVKETYKQVASSRPVPLGAGRFLGSVRGQKETLDGWATFNVVRDAYGKDAADKAVEVKASKASVERALAPLAPPRGKGKFINAAIEQIRSAGGTRFEPTETVTEYSAGELAAVVDR